MLVNVVFADVIMPVQDPSEHGSRYPGYDNMEFSATKEAIIRLAKYQIIILIVLMIIKLIVFIVYKTKGNLKRLNKVLTVLLIIAFVITARLLLGPIYLMYLCDQQYGM